MERNIIIFMLIGIPIFLFFNILVILGAIDDYPILLIPASVILCMLVYKSHKKEQALHERLRKAHIEEEHVKDLYSKAKKGDVSACFDYGSLVLLGKGVEKKERVAMNWIEYAASKNEPRALSKMAEIYEKGLYSFPKDKSISFGFLRKAASFGHEASKIIVGQDLASREREHNLETELERLSRSAWEQYHSLGTAANMDTMTGLDFEKFIGKLYTKMGYKVIFTKNNDQGTDLIAIDGDEKISVQVKRYKNTVGNKAVQETIAGASYHNCNKTVVVTNSTFTKSARDLAKRSNTELIDGRKLLHLARKSFDEEVKPFNWLDYYALKDEISRFTNEIQHRIQRAEEDLKSLKYDKYHSPDAVSCRRIRWKYRCHLNWDELETTDLDNVKHCGQCNSRVYHTTDKALLAQYISEGKCTASSIKTKNTLSQSSPPKIGNGENGRIELGLRV